MRSNAQFNYIYVWKLSNLFRTSATYAGKWQIDFRGEMQNNIEKLFQFGKDTYAFCTSEWRNLHDNTTQFMILLILML